MKAFLFASLVLGVLVMSGPGSAMADGAGSSDVSRATGKPEDPNYTAAVKAIEAKDFARAIPLLEGVVARDTTNADAYNWLAYATRRNGNPAGAIPIYQKALAID